MNESREKYPEPPFFLPETRPEDAQTVAQQRLHRVDGDVQLLGNFFILQLPHQHALHHASRLRRQPVDHPRHLVHDLLVQRREYLFGDLHPGIIQGQPQHVLPRPVRVASITNRGVQIRTQRHRVHAIQVIPLQQANEKILHDILCRERVAQQHPGVQHQRAVVALEQ